MRAGPTVACCKVNGPEHHVSHIAYPTCCEVAGKPEHHVRAGCRARISSPVWVFADGDCCEVADEPEHLRGSHGRREGDKMQGGIHELLPWRRPQRRQS